MKELVSIIIPVYNACQYLTETVKSLTAQTYKKIEILLVDDGSTDGSAELAQRLAKTDGRIRPLPKPHGGVTAARRYGVEQAVGTWVVFVDADDTLPPDAVEYLHAQAAGEQIDLVLGNWRIVWPSTSSSRNGLIPLSGIITPERYVRALLKGDAPAGILGKIIRRSSLTESDALNIPPEITNNEDLLMNLTLTSNLRRLKICPRRVVYHYIKREGSASQKALPVAWWDKLFAELDKVLGGKFQPEYWRFVANTMVRQTLRHPESDFRQSAYFDALAHNTRSPYMRLQFRYLKKRDPFSLRFISAIRFVQKIKKLLRCLLTFFPI